MNASYHCASDSSKQNASLFIGSNSKQDKAVYSSGTCRTVGPRLLAPGYELAWFE